MKIDLENPTTREVLGLLGAGILITATMIMPGLPLAAKPIIDIYEKKQEDKQIRAWNRFNQARLKQLLKRFYMQNIVEIVEEDGVSMVKLTIKGKTRLLKYKLEEMMIDKPPRWDGRWRLIIYDIKSKKRVLSEIFRSFLKKMEFFKLQRSVYLTPYPCQDQIEFLRQYYGLNEEILYLEVNKLENDQVYRNYFGI